jgi:hypothetical protein
MVLANLQCGAVDEAARWLAKAERSGGEDAADVSIFHFGARAEILLARGDVDGGLRSWRRAVEALRTTEHPGFGGAPPELDPLTLETKAVTVIAHARHGRLDLVTDLADELPGTLSRVLADLTAAAPAPYDCLPVNGTLLLALAIVDLDRAERAGDVHARGSVARMIALAERFRFVRGFQPTMSPAHATHTAEQADKSAYTDAVSTYADLTRAELLAAARDQLTARDRG